jgi:S1-C subfamily serine protease
MKKLRQSPGGVRAPRIPGALALTIAALWAAPLFAQQQLPPLTVPPVTQMGNPGNSGDGGDILVLPVTWKILNQDVERTEHADHPATPASPAAPVPFALPMPGKPVSIDSQTAAVVMTAAPTDFARKVTLTLYRYHLREMGIGGMMGEIQMVLMQGYNPSSELVTQGVTKQNKPYTTIEIIGKNTAGEERTFSETMVMTATQMSFANPSYRLFTSRPSTDGVSAQEIDAIIKSLNLPEPKLPQPSTAQNPQNPLRPAVVQNPNPPAMGQPQPPGAVPPGSVPPGAVPPGAPQPVDTSSASVLAQTGPTSEQSAQIVQDFHSALMMVEGNKGVGSGFLCKIDNKSYIVTNAHVLADNSGVKLTNLDGTAFSIKDSGVAVDYDIVKMEVDPASAPKTFEVMTNLDSTVKIGDSVVVPGNAEGAQVVRAVEGKIVGIGPKLIEVDAPFVKGNSGSPIIHVATGKVLGVATYLMQRKVSQDAQGKVELETRRFGYRIDSVKAWQPINWQVFYAESAQVGAIEDLSDDFGNMFDDMNRGKLSEGSYKSAVLTRAVRSFLEAASHLKSQGSLADKQELLRRFFADLRAATQGDITAFDARPAYDYFRRDVDDQERFRNDLYDIFTRIMQNESR